MMPPNFPANKGRSAFKTWFKSI